jgi:hypothetical protein
MTALLEPSTVRASGKPPREMYVNPDAPETAADTPAEEEAEEET